MSPKGEPKNPIDQLVDLFVYAPVGFLYEKDAVLDKVVARGKSQVQLARLMAKMASNQPGGTEAMVGDAVGFAADVVSKGIAEFGVALGLIPSPVSEPTTVVDADEHVTNDVVVDDLDEPDLDATDETATGSALAIADYDSMNARSVIAALDTLSPVEVAAVADYERQHRNRKTILAKADRIAG